MNKRLSIGLSIGTIIIGIGSFTGYSYVQKNKKETLSKEFVTSFEKKEFKEMVHLFSKNSLKKENISEKDLINKYDTIFNGLNVGKIKNNHLDVTKDNELNTSFTMTTPLGKMDSVDYKAKIIKENGKYVIDWKYDLILPKMGSGDKVYLTTDEPARSQIVDRDGQPLATNEEFPEIGLVPGKMGDESEKKETLTKLGKLVDMSEEELQKLLAQSWVTMDSFVPVKILDKSVDLEPYTSIQGVSVQNKTGRYYPLGEAAAQLIGYTGTITAEDIEADPTLSGYQQTGKSGLEQYFDKELRGQTGGQINIVDEDENIQEVLQEKEKKEGTTIKLTINSSNQKEAFTDLKNHTGATVITQPKTGDLLAAVSSPSYDPNKMVQGISPKDYETYIKDEKQPFLARYSVGYAPGSTFKTITAAIGIDENITTPSKTRKINGLKWQKDGSWGDYFVTRVSDVPNVNMNTALIYSDNIYFAQEGLEIGSKNYLKGLEKFPFGEKMNLGIPMTPAQISNETINKDILLADTAYGQGELLINPIQQAAMYSVFANEGNMVYPKIKRDVKDKRKEGVISKQASQDVKAAMVQVVEDSNGTAHSLTKGTSHLAAKTGTAEIKEKQDIKGKENSFLLAFDADNNDFLVVTVIENAEDISATKLDESLINSLSK